MKRTAAGKEQAIEHPLYHLLACEPNPWMTSYFWRERMIYHRLLGGNSYDAIIRNGGGRVVELRPVHFSQVRVGILDGKKVFKYRGDFYPDGDFLHIPNVSQDGLTGDSTITFARTSISLGLAAEQYGARVFSQGTNSNKWIEFPAKLDDDQLKRLRESWSGNYAGITNAHKIPIMQNGAKLHEIPIANDDIQFLGTRQFNVVDVARWFRVPPHKIGDLQRSTNNNIEHQAIEFVTDNIGPVAVLIEQELNKKLLLPSERGKYFFRFNLYSLLRGDLQSRYTAYGIGRQWGWLSADDIREAEDMNALPDGQGKVYLDPINMAPAIQFLAGGTQNPAKGKKIKDESDPDDELDSLDE
jgi:HK97 family phage portal protein